MTTTDEGMKFAFVIAAIEESPYWDSLTEEEAVARWDGWLARVRRDAWTEGCRAAEQYYRRTVVGIPGLDPIPAPVNPHEDTP